MAFDNLTPVIGTGRSGDSNDPYNIITNDVQKVVNGMVRLKEVPYFNNHVVITAVASPYNNEVYYETFDYSSNIGRYNYRVDYTNGIVFFSEESNGRTMTFSYTGKGYDSLSMWRIHTKEQNGDVIETLGDIIEAGETAIESLTQLNIVINNAETATSNANTAATNANTKATLADQKATLANTATIAANNATTEAINATTNANDSAELADIATAEANNTITSLSYIGVYENITLYKKRNFVIYENALYRCIQDSTGHLPTDSAYWINVTKTLTWRDEYNNTTSYSVFDAIEFDGSSYICLKDSIGHSPLDITYWKLLAQKGDKGATLVYRGDYNASKLYLVNELVRYEGNVYVCIQDSVNNLPIDINYWDVFIEGGGTKVVSYKNTVELSVNTSTVTIGISQYTHTSDVLMVFKNTTYIEKDIDYTISSDGLSINKVGGEWTTPSTFNFIVLKNVFVNSVEYDGDLLINGSVTNDKLSDEIKIRNYNGQRYQINNPYKNGGKLSLKGQMHCHTTNSDGQQSPTDVVTAYKNAGYDFITITDHNVITSNPNVSGITWIGNSTEETEKRHVCAYDIDTQSTDVNTQDILNYHRNLGKMTNIAHPNWHSLYFIDKNEALGFYDFNFTEIYNTVTDTYGEIQWDWWLSNGKKTFALAVDDCHNITDALQFNKAWVVVKADTNNKSSILDSLRKGNFYASTGNDISINLYGNTITASSTDLSNFTFIGRDGKILFTANNVLNSSYVIKGDEAYVRAVSEKVSDISQKAWSQPVFIDIIGDNERQFSEIYTTSNLYGMKRQAIINGNFDIWQAGTALSNLTYGYLADRWLISSGSGGGVFPNINHSRQQIIPENIQNASNYYRITTDGAGSNFGTSASYLFSQAIENGTRFLCGAGKKLTISFYARSSIPNKKLAINLVQQYGVGGSPDEQVIGTNFTLTAMWKKYSYTFVTNSLIGKTFGVNNDDVLRVRFWIMWGSTFLSRFGATEAETFVGAGDIDIAQVQLCAGSTELSFNPRSYAEELALCQRYNKRLVSDADYSVFGSGQCISTTQAYIYIPLSPTMRINPILTTGGNFALLKSDGTYQAVTAVAIHKTGRDGLYLIATVASGLTAGNATMLVANNDITAYLNFDANII